MLVGVGNGEWEDMDSPCNAYALRHLQCFLEAFAVYGCDAVNAESCSEQYKCWLELAVLSTSNLQKGVFIDIRVVWPDVYTKV